MYGSPLVTVWFATLKCVRRRGKHFSASEADGRSRDYIT